MTKNVAPSPSANPRKPRLPFLWQGDADAPSPEILAATMGRFAAGEFDPSVPAHAEEVVHAWYALSRVVAEEFTIVRQLSSLLRLHLMALRADKIGSEAEGFADPDVEPPMSDDPLVEAATSVVEIALPVLSSSADVSDDDLVQKLRRMATALDPLGGATALTRQRAAIKRIVEWSADEEAVPREFQPDDEEEADDPETGMCRLTDEQWREERATFLREQLSKLDPRLKLDESTARALLRFFGRKNGAQTLAANWAWRAGVEGAAGAGESLSGDAPERVLARYRDPAKKKAARKKKGET